MSKGVFFAIFVIAFSVSHLNAAVWTGNGLDNNWSTGSNWSTGVAPSSVDSAEFDNTSDKLCVIDSLSSGIVRCIRLRSNFVGTIQLGKNLQINDTLEQNGGTILCSNRKLIIKKYWTQNGGQFSATTDTISIAYGVSVSLTGGSLLHNSGTILIGSATHDIRFENGSLNNLVLTCGNITFNSVVTVLGNLTANAANAMIGGRIDVYGNVLTGIRSSSTPYSTTIRITGSVNQQLSTMTGAGKLPSLEIDKNGGELLIQDTIMIGGDWKYVNGGINTANSTVIFVSEATIQAGSKDFSNLVFSSPGNIYIVGKLNVTNDLSIIHANCLSGDTINAYGNVYSTVRSASTPYNTVLKLTGSTNQIISAMGGSGFLPKIEVAKQNGSVLTLLDTLVVRGGWNYISGSVSPSSSTVIFTGAEVNSGTESFDNVIINSQGVVSILGDLSIKGDLSTVSSNGWVGGGTFRVEGNVINTITSMSSPRASSLVFCGETDQTISQGANAPWMTGGFTINKSAGMVRSITDISLPIGLSVVSGVFEQGATNGLRLNGDLVISSSGQFINIGSGYDSLGGAVINDGLVTINGGTENCGEVDAIKIRSISATQRNWSGSGIFKLSDIDVKDMSTSGQISAYSSTNSGNVTGGWSVLGSCPSFSRDYKSGLNEYTIGTLVNINVTVDSVRGNNPWTIYLDTATTVSTDLSRIFPNDCFTDGSSNQNKWKVVSVDNLSGEIVVSNSEYISGNDVLPSASNLNQATLGRWFSGIQAWVSDRGGDLINTSRIEKGICYNDGVFTHAQFKSDTVKCLTSSSDFYMWLTVAEGERHNGKSGVGVRIDRQGRTNPALFVKSNFSVVDGLAIYNIGDTWTSKGVFLQAQNCTIRNMLVHQGGEASIGIYTHEGNGAASNKFYNNTVYNIAGTGIFSYQNLIHKPGTLILNNTVYACETGILSGGTRTGALEQDTMKNNLVLGCTQNYNLLVTAVLADYNAGEDGNMPPEGSYNVTTSATEEFVSTETGSIDLSLKRSAKSIMAADSAGLTSLFHEDASGDNRSRKWDIGSDQWLSTQPTDNDFQLISEWKEKKTVQITWTPSLIDSAGADSVKISYKTNGYPTSNDDPEATHVGTFSKDDSIQSTSGLNGNTLYYFSAFVKDINGVWTELSLTASDTAFVPGDISKYSKSYKDEATYDYLIITDGDSLNLNQYQRLALLKKARGLKTKIVTLDEISNAFSGVDIQEKIRNYIRFAYNEYKITWVLLGGDYAQIPPRYLYSNMNGGTEIMSDMYYSCLDGDFNTVRDDKIGTVSDEADYIPDVIIGRIPSGDWNEARIMIDKIMKYSFKGMKGSGEKQVLLSGMYQLGKRFSSEDGGYIDDGSYYAHRMIKPLMASQDIEEIYEDSINGTTIIDDSITVAPSKILNSLYQNELKKNLWVHYGHGGEWAIQTTQYYNNNIDSAINITNRDLLKNNRHSDSALATSAHCMIVGCGTATPNKTSIARAFMNSYTGTLTYFAASNYDYPSSSISIQKAFIRSIYQDSVFSVGKAATLAKLDLEAISGVNKYDFSKRWLHYSYTFLGDPELEIWTDSLADADSFSINNINNMNFNLGVNQYTMQVLKNGQPNTDKNVIVTIFQDSGSYLRYGVNPNNPSTVTVNYPVERKTGMPVYIGVAGHTGFTTVYKRNVTDTTYISYVQLKDKSAINGLGGMGDTLGYILNFQNIGDRNTNNVSFSFFLADSSDSVLVQIIEGNTSVSNISGGNSHDVLLRLSILPVNIRDSIIPISVKIVENGKTYWDRFNAIIASKKLEIHKTSVTRNGSILSVNLDVINSGSLIVPSGSISLLMTPGDASIISVTPTMRYFSNFSTTDTLQLSYDVIVQDTNSYQFSVLKAVLSYKGVNDTLRIALRKPMSVSELSGLGQGQGSILVHWKPQEQDIEGYNIYRSDSAATLDFKKLNKDILIASYYVDNKDLTVESKTYVYKVEVINKSMIRNDTSTLCTLATQLPLLEGFPQYKNTYISTPYVVDLDNDGKKEFVYSDGNGTVYAIRPNLDEYIVKRDNDGEMFTIGSGSRMVLPSVGDVDGDERPDVVQARGNRLAVYFTKNDTWIRFDSVMDASFWNKRFEQNSVELGQPVLRDIDNDGKDEILVGVDDATQSPYQKMYLFKYDNVNGKIIRIGTHSSQPQSRLSGAAVGNLTSSSGLEFTFPVASNGLSNPTEDMLYVYNYASYENSGGSTSAQPIDSISIGVGRFIPKQLVLADLDKDGFDEAVFCYVDGEGKGFYGGGQLHLGVASFQNKSNNLMVNEPLGNWDFNSFNLSPVVSDANNDNNPDILYYHDDKVYIFYLNGNGSLLSRDSIVISEKYKNYFTSYYKSPVASVLCVDLDNDGVRDIVVGASVAGRSSYILAFSGSPGYKPLSGFPIYAGNSELFSESPMFGIDDIDNNGKYEIFYFGNDAGMYVWKTDGNVDISGGSWLCQGHDFNNSKNTAWNPDTFATDTTKLGRILIYDNLIYDNFGDNLPYQKYPFGGIPDNFVESKELNDAMMLPSHNFKTKRGSSGYLTNDDYLNIPENINYVSQNSFDWKDYQIGSGQYINGTYTSIISSENATVADQGVLGAGILFYSKLPFEESYYLLSIDSITGFWDVKGMSNSLPIVFRKNEGHNDSYSNYSLNYKVKVVTNDLSTDIDVYHIGQKILSVSDTSQNRLRNGTVGFFAANKNGVTVKRSFGGIVVQEVKKDE